MLYALICQLKYKMSIFFNYNCKLLLASFMLNYFIIFTVKCKDLHPLGWSQTFTGHLASTSAH